MELSLHFVSLGSSHRLQVCPFRQKTSLMAGYTSFVSVTPESLAYLHGVSVYVVLSVLSSILVVLWEAKSSP